jgi:hypothetical protein
MTNVIKYFNHQVSSCHPKLNIDPGSTAVEHLTYILKSKGSYPDIDTRREKTVAFKSQRDKH